MNKKIIILYGSPGAGKDTQAEKIAEKYGLYHFKTSYFLKKIAYNPALQNNPIIKRERENLETGKLMTPSWVSEIVKKESDNLIDKVRGFIFNGTPRTLYEAQEIIPYWEFIFGKENISVVEIVIKPETTIFRNTHRRVCQKCGNSLLYTPGIEKISRCPVCGGPIVVRVDDKEDIIKVRLEEYREHTEPIFDYLRSKNYEIIEIDGEPSPEKVTEQIFLALDRKIIE